MRDLFLKLARYPCQKLFPRIESLEIQLLLADTFRSLFNKACCSSVLTQAL